MGVFPIFRLLPRIAALGWASALTSLGCMPHAAVKLGNQDAICFRHLPPTTALLVAEREPHGAVAPQYAKPFPTAHWLRLFSCQGSVPASAIWQASATCPTFRQATSKPAQLFGQAHSYPPSFSAGFQLTGTNCKKFAPVNWGIPGRIKGSKKAPRRGLFAAWWGRCYLANVTVNCTEWGMRFGNFLLTGRNTETVPRPMAFCTDSAMHSSITCWASFS